MLRLITVRHGGGYRLELHGTLGGEWVPLLEKHWRALRNGAPAAVTVVLSDVDFIDADGERLLRRMADSDVQFEVSGTSQDGTGRCLAPMKTRGWLS